MKDYEYLRQLEYRLAIMRDKYDYLGEEYCTPEERKLAMLVDFHKQLLLLSCSAGTIHRPKSRAMGADRRSNCSDGETGRRGG